MCLIELKNAPKPIVSCAMNAKSCLANGDIFTNSSLVKKARENILEFLLLNHPLDCPICDQGGECDLQDQSLFFGLTKKRFYNFKRIVINKNIGPIVKTVMTRCIHCTRCVRFAAEIAGVDNIGMFGRGLHSEIGTYVEKIFQSELSGNVIDLCPVGALTSKPYPFVSRSWELKNVTFIDFSDGLSTPTQLFIKNNQIIKILPSYDKTSSKTNWISDKTRFSFDGMFSPERITYNFIKTNDNLIVGLPWKKLFKEIFCALYFKKHLSKHLCQPFQITICLSKNISLEVLNLLYLLSNKYSFFKLRQSESQKTMIDIEQNYLLNSNMNSSKFLSSDTCLLIGINPRYEGSQLSLTLRSRFLKGNFNIVQISPLSNITCTNRNLSNNTQTCFTLHDIFSFKMLKLGLFYFQLSGRSKLLFRAFFTVISSTGEILAMESLADTALDSVAYLGLDDVSNDTSLTPEFSFSEPCLNGIAISERIGAEVVGIEVGPDNWDSSTVSLSTLQQSEFSNEPKFEFKSFSIKRTLRWVMSQFPHSVWNTGEEDSSIIDCYTRGGLGWPPRGEDTYRTASVIDPLDMEIKLDHSVVSLDHSVVSSLGSDNLLGVEGDWPGVQYDGNSANSVDYGHTRSVMMEIMQITFTKLLELSTIGSDKVSNLFEGSLLNNESLSGYAVLEDNSSEDRSSISSLSGYIEEDDSIISELSKNSNSLPEKIAQSSQSVLTSGYVKTINSQESEYSCNCPDYKPYNP